MQYSIRVNKHSLSDKILLHLIIINKYQIKSYYAISLCDYAKTERDNRGKSHTCIGSCSNGNGFDAGLSLCALLDGNLVYSRIVQPSGLLEY